MSRPAGLCIFCGAIGNLSKQHVLPDRLKKLVPRVTPVHSQELTHVKKAPSGGVLIQPNYRQREGHLGNKRARRVCVSCNTKWMKTAEEAAFEIAQPLILGQWDSSLTLEAQERLALLAAIITTVADLDDPPTAAISQAERSWIFENKSLPEGWSAFVGRVQSDQWTTRWLHWGLALSDTPPLVEPAPCNTQWTTIAMGQLLLQVVSFRPPLQLHAGAHAAKLGLAAIHPTSQNLDLANLPIHDDASASRAAHDLFDVLTRVAS